MFIGESIFHNSRFAKHYEWHGGRNAIHDYPCSGGGVGDGRLCRLGGLARHLHFYVLQFENDDAKLGLASAWN